MSSSKGNSSRNRRKAAQGQEFESCAEARSNHAIAVKSSDTVKNGVAQQSKQVEVSDLLETQQFSQSFLQKLMQPQVDLEKKRSSRNSPQKSKRAK